MPEHKSTESTKRGLLLTNIAIQTCDFTPILLWYKVTVVCHSNETEVITNSNEEWDKTMQVILSHTACAFCHSVMVSGSYCQRLNFFTHSHTNTFFCSFPHIRLR